MWYMRLQRQTLQSFFFFLLNRFCFIRAEKIKKKHGQSQLLFWLCFHQTDGLEKLWDDGNNDIIWRKQKELAGQWQRDTIVLKDDQKNVFVRPIVHNNGTGMFTSLKESLSEKDMKERIPKVASCILWVCNGKVHITRAQNHSGDQGSTCFFNFWMKAWISSTWLCSKNRDAWWKQMSTNRIFDSQD